MLPDPKKLDPAYSSSFDSMFVGREREIGEFRTNLGQAAPDYALTYYRAEGGGGKSWLLRKFEKVATAEKVPHAFVQLRNDQGRTTQIQILVEIARNLKRTGNVNLPRFTAAIMLLMKRNLLQSHPGDPMGNFTKDLATTSISELGTYLATSAVGPSGWIAFGVKYGVDKLWDKAKEWLSKDFLTSPKGKDFLESLSAKNEIETRENLVAWLAEDLREALPKRTGPSAVFLFDTVEDFFQTSFHERHKTAEQELGELWQATRQEVQWMMAGQSHLDRESRTWNPPELSSEIELDGWDKPTAIRYIQEKARIERQVWVARLLKIAEEYFDQSGTEFVHPLTLAVACFAAKSAPESMDPEDFSLDLGDTRDVLDRLFRTTDETTRAAVDVLAITPRFDARALSVAYECSDQQAIARWTTVKDWPFMDPVDDVFYRLHGTMRRLIRQRIVAQESERLPLILSQWHEYWTARGEVGLALRHGLEVDFDAVITAHEATTNAALQAGETHLHARLVDAWDEAEDAFAHLTDEQRARCFGTQANGLKNKLVNAGPGDLERAISLYSAALEVYKRETSPTNWAMTQNNLGNVLSNLGERSGDKAVLQDAVNAYRADLEVLTRQTSPVQWAMNQNNLGNALSHLGERSGDEAVLQDAVNAYRAALEVHKRETSPMQWAMTQNNLGNALQTLGERSGDEAVLREAVKAYRSAMEVRKRDTSPLEWAATQNNLGTTLQTLGERSGDEAVLHEAINSYRAALEVRAREAFPLEWAMTENNLGNALSVLGERSGEEAVLQQAVNAYRAALEVYQRDTSPMQWGRTQNNLGAALHTLGERSGDEAVLGQAVNAYRAALQVRTRETSPMQWAITTANLGDACRVLATVTRSCSELRRAIRRLSDSSESILSGGGYLSWWILVLHACRKAAEEIPCPELLAEIDALLNQLPQNPS